MGELRTLPEQIINGQSDFYALEAQELIEQLKGMDPSASTHYTVISIIGPQNSGKSYLLNALFGTKFEVLRPGSSIQTTKGIWITGCIDPCMIIMDIEGFDGQERGQDDLFEKRSALFASRVSDVLLLNIWFHDKARQRGANLELIKLIFKKMSAKEAPKKKTIVVIVVRDHDYDQCTPHVTEKDVMAPIEKLWYQEYPATTNMRMSDYVEVIVKDLPNKKEEKFARKVKDLAKLLCDIARGVNSGQKPNFAHNSRVMWDLIRKDKWIIASGDEPQLATDVCKETRKYILGTLDNDKGYESLRSNRNISVKDFNKQLSSFLKGILDRYEEETATFSIYRVWGEEKINLEKMIVERFKEIFEEGVKRLVEEIQCKAESNLHGQLDKIAQLDPREDGVESEVHKVLLENYVNVFDDNCLADFNSNFQPELQAQRNLLLMNLVTMAAEVADKIQSHRGIIKGLKITAKAFIGAVGVITGGISGAMAGVGLAAAAGMESVSAAIAALGVGFVGGAVTAGVSSISGSNALIRD